jgi:hypothetical protein
MQKLRLQNVWSKETNSFDKANFELRESEKTISGKVSISSKKNDKWLSKPLPFVAFKSQIDQATTRALLHSKGKSFEAEFGIIVDSFTDQETGKDIVYFKLVINSAMFEGVAPAQVESQSDFQEDEIPF